MSSNEAPDVLGDILSTFQNLLKDASDFGYACLFTSIRFVENLVRWST